jgi:hypothetical protein
MGCIGRLGCLVVLVVLGVVAWLFRDRWLHLVNDGASGRPDSVVVAGRERVWEPLTPQGGERARRALAQLEQPNGPSTVTVTVPDLAAYVYQELARQLPPSADSVEAMAKGDRLYLRASVRIQELGAKEMLGPLAAMLGERERLEIGGNLRVVRPGLGELVVRELRVGQLPIPPGVIPRIVRQISRRDRPADISESGLPLRLPAHIGDVRIAGGSMTITRATR